jgi:hypothetical protein
MQLHKLIDPRCFPKCFRNTSRETPSETPKHLISFDRSVSETLPDRVFPTSTFPLGKVGITLDIRHEEARSEVERTLVKINEAAKAAAAGIKIDRIQCFD